MPMGFVCDKCGKCCRHLDTSSAYAELNRGDGVCRHLEGKLCSIYATRPLLCRVDESYDALFKGKMSKEEYYKLNYMACDIIKKMK